jgi:1-acyl-sn-glycerol-3-phosphate acyltransferase
MIIFLRSLAFNLFFYLWTAFMLFISLPLLLLPKGLSVVMCQIWAQVVLFALQFIANIRYEIRGCKYLGGKYGIIAAKHQSAWDTIIYFVLFKNPALVLKKELTLIPIYRSFIYKLGMIVVDQKKGSKTLRELLNATRSVLDKGRHLVLFPEGTRTTPGESIKYNPGIAALYTHFNLPVIPVAVNSGCFWGRRNFLKKPGTIVLEFLQPIEPGLDRYQFLGVLKTRIDSISNQLIPKEK